MPIFCVNNSIKMELLLYMQVLMVLAFKELALFLFIFFLVFPFHSENELRPQWPAWKCREAQGLSQKWGHFRPSGGHRWTPFVKQISKAYMGMQFVRRERTPAREAPSLIILRSPCLHAKFGSWDGAEIEYYASSHLSNLTSSICICKCQLQITVHWVNTRHSAG